MSDDNRFRIISVTGAHSQVGKTTLCSVLLKHLTGFGAIKFTKSSLYTSISDSQDIIEEEGKDTAIMTASGAEKVVWIKSSGSDLNNALEIAIAKMIGCRGVIIEGNSPADLLDPDLIIFVIGVDGHIKSSAKTLFRKSDIIVVNCTGQTEGKSLPKSVETGQEVFTINLNGKTGEISPFLRSVEKRLSEELQ